MTFLKSLGRVTWVLIGIGLAIAIFSWAKYFFTHQNLSAVVIFVPLVALVGIFIVYLIITFTAKIFARSK